MKSVSIMWTEGVRREEAQVVINTVRRLMRLLHQTSVRAGLALAPATIRPFGTWYVPDLPAGTPYYGTQWYLESSYDRKLDKVRASKFLELIGDEPWQKVSPHFDVAIIDHDLADSGDGLVISDSSAYLLGAVVPGLATVLSVHRLRYIENLRLKRLALRHLTTHYLGHVLGLPARSREEAIDSSLGERNCVNVCSMRHARTLEELVRFAVEEDNAGLMLCTRCRSDLIEFAILSHYSPN